MTINSTSEIINALKKGEMVIIMDDENRENEGDLVIASQFVKPKDINFMASYAKGLICLTLTTEKCKKLGLPLMNNLNDSLKSTNFTISIDAADGITTGISASDRAKTIRKAVEKNVDQAIWFNLVIFFRLWQKMWCIDKSRSYRGWL